MSGARAGPWCFRLFEAAPLPPVGAGVALAVLLLGSFVGVELAAGRLGPMLADASSSRVFRGILVLLAMLAYVPTASFHLARWTRRNLEALRPLLRAPALDVAPTALGPGALHRLVGVAGAVSFALLFLPIGQSVYLRSEYWSFEHALPWLAVPVLGWLMARFAHALVADALTVSARADELERIDLIDVTPLAPFAQQGLGSALLVMLMLAIGMGGLVGQEVVLPSAITATVVMLGVGTTALLLPAMGVRRRIRAEKRAQLGILRRRIDAARLAALAGGGDGDAASSRLPGLLALEDRLVGVREWPFDVSSLLRFALYLSLGLGSWLGAAFVERVLDWALD